MNKKGFIMNEIEKRLKELNIILPKAKEGVGAYKSWTIFSNNIICTSGQLPWDGNELKYKGKLGKDVSIEDGYNSARLCTINAIAQLKDAVGDLSRIKQIIRVEGNINTTEDFIEHSKVLDGASELLNTIFGEVGIHTRTAQGMYSSPLNACTLIYLFAEIK